MTALGDQKDSVLARDGDLEESAGLGTGGWGEFRCDDACGSTRWRHPSGRWETFTWVSYLELILFQKNFWPRHSAGRILVPRSGMEPVPSAIRVQSPNH